jgi:hypothetical protein
LIKRDVVMSRLLAVNVGLPQNIEWRGENVHTGICKHPVQGRCAARGSTSRETDREISPVTAASNVR